MTRDEGVPEPAGILDPGRIDRVTTAGDGFVELHVVQSVQWDGTDHLLLLTQEKLYNYLAYVADGDLAREHPEAGRRWRVVIDVQAEPDQRTGELLRRADDEFRRLGGSLITRQTRTGR